MFRVLPATAVVALLAGALTHPAAAQSVDAIVAKNLQAKGGVETLSKTNTVKMTGTLTSPGAPGPLTMELVAKRPNLMRREMRMGEQSMVSAFDGTTAWVMRGGGPPQELTGPEAAQLKQGAEFDSVFLNYKEAGHTVELIGTEPVDGKPAHHLKITRKDGLVQHYYLDTASGLEVRMAMDTEQAGVKLKVETQLSDYRDVDGRMVPFTMKQFTNGAPAGVINFQSIAFNVPIDDAMFALPRR